MNPSAFPSPAYAMDNLALAGNARKSTKVSPWISAGC